MRILSPRPERQAIGSRIKEFIFHEFLYLDPGVSILEVFGRPSALRTFVYSRSSSLDSLAGEYPMKKPIKAKTTKRSLPIPWISLKGKEREAFLSSVQQLDEQCDRLGLLNPTEFEPAILYSAMDGEK